jgi:hypothetical protein
MAPESPFIGSDGEPKLIECAVLFFDLLGVSAMARGAKAEHELLRFNRTIRDAFPYPIGVEAAAGGDSAAYPTTVFSDSVVAAVPIPPTLPPALAIFQLALDVAQLQTELAGRKYFARGAITLDKFHFYDGLAFGPALVEAVSLEREIAVDPRIVLSPRAVGALRGGRKQGPERIPFDSGPLLVDQDGVVFVDYLSGAFQADPEIDLPQTLRLHQTVVAEQLRGQATDFSRWSKYRWVAEYHNATCRSNREVLERHGGFEEFAIDAIHTERQFSFLA